MTCTGCETHIKRELGQVAGVIDVEVSYETSEAVIYTSEPTLQTKDLLQAVKKAGYTASLKKQS